MKSLFAGFIAIFAMISNLSAQDDDENVLLKAPVGTEEKMVQQQGAYEHETPQQIQQELDESEKMFEDAKKMFNPWYTGPLVTPSATMVPPGWGMLQPYLVIQDNYAAFDSHRKSISLPNSKVFVNPFAVLQMGVTKTVDAMIIVGGQENWQAGKSGGGLTDTTLGIGFLVQKQAPYVPQIKFSIQETCPTGRYQNLSSNGLALGGIGGGSWQTQFSLTMAKVLFWSRQNPINTRLSFQYKIPSKVHVEGFNAYGGGYGTRGTAHPGNTFSADLGLEVSIVQRWVIATDLVYSATNATSFSGTPGTTTKGGKIPALTGGPYNDNLSLAPAVEYNWSENLGVIAGVQFSVYGRNSSNFVNGQFSVCWVFPAS